MIRVPADVLKTIVDAAEAAYPEESCGLLVGRVLGNGDIAVTRAEVSENRAEGGRRSRFEVDPLLRLRLMKDLRGGADRIVGHFHSHPDHAAQPSAHDLAHAFEPELVWLITSVAGGQAIHTTAHVLDPAARQFREIRLHTDDWQPYPMQDSPFPSSEEPQ